jgi:hypothetical protein
MPQIVTDVYRDLRDRRLLPIVIVLLVALVAVPVALMASSGTPAPTSSAPIAEEVSAPEAQPAVLAVNRDLRDYRKRLAGLNRRNPFRQQFLGGGLSKTEVKSASGVAGETISAEEPSASAGSAPISTGTPTGSSSTSGGNPKPRTVTRLATFRVDVRFGPAGDTKNVKDVKPLDALNPVAVFVGASEDGKKALFSVSSKVDAASGDGNCLALGSTGCGLLVLKKGDVARLDYAPDGKSYVLSLSDIERVLLK